MKNSTKPFEITAIFDSITIQRNNDGVPTITAKNQRDLCYGIGYAHATDRLVQMMLVRAIVQGRSSEKFAGDDELIEIDKFMRWIFLEKDIEQEIDKLEPEIKQELDAYCAGINSVIAEKKRSFEFLLTGYKPEPWGIKDSIATAKVMGFVGLAQTQVDMQKFLIQMIQQGASEEKIKALFPYLTEKIDSDLIKSIQLDMKIIPDQIWNGVLPNFKASNNWAVSGEKTKSGHPMLATDPHLEVNRLPAVWYEMVGNVNGEKIMGITMPGLPMTIMGRTKNLAWGGTYGFMDMIDYFIEDCEDEKFLYDEEWKSFEKREEIIKPKKKDPIHLTFYENHHGVLEGNPAQSGKYLAMAYTGRSGAGADVFNTTMRIHTIRTVKEAQQLLRGLAAPTFNWALADREGNIGFQMSGKMPKRADGFSGLLPIPGWDSANDWQGFENSEQHPSCLNPESGFFATANNDLNKFGENSPINICMAPYRVQRIMEILAENQPVDAETFQAMHYDLYSKQAERLMPLFFHLLPDTENGKILKEWDFVYDENSKGAMLFESVYRNLIEIVFGKNGIGEEAMAHLLDETILFSIYFGNFDDVIMDENSPWFAETSRLEMLKKAIEKGLDVSILPYGETRKYDMNNIFLGGKFPGFFGFDLKNKTLPGSRATIPQGQICRFGGRISTFSPSFRMIAEMQKDEILTNLPGGPSGKRFSKWYKSDLKNWENGRYKLVK